MSEQTMEYVIKQALTGSPQKNALELAAFLSTSGISQERATTGYWEDKIYYVCNYNNQSVCYISINEHEDNSWYVTGDDSGSNWFENVRLSEPGIAWANIDICTDRSSCGACGSPGKMSRKKIFGKEFDNVCPVTIKFTKPGMAEVECMKQIFEVRKNYILETTKAKR